MDDQFWLFYIPQNIGIGQGQRGPYAPKPPNPYPSRVDAKEVPVPAGFTPWIQTASGYHTLLAGRRQFWPFTTA